tara:strand:- start:1242 stop:2192 length:951 start_codon:yes stop_codon:yes gene_type:complete
MKDLNILIPTYNDEKSISKLLSEINIEGENIENFKINIIIIDDGSIQNLQNNQFLGLNNISIFYLKLNKNYGHQMAIYVGLLYCNQNNKENLIIMDGDGEDKPSDIKKILNESYNHPDKTIVARRLKRRDSILFKIMYFFYKILFFILTGKKINFGNFCFICKNHLKILLSHASLKQHLASTILKSQIPIKRISLDKGKRYFGKPKMNLENLIFLGLNAITVFSSQVIIRVIIISIIFFLILSIFFILVFYMRFFSDFLIPGQATYALGFLITINLIILVNSLLLSFMHSPLNSNNDLKDYDYKNFLLFEENFKNK